MTDTNQKLREAFETYITDGGKWPNAILKAPGGQYLLLRTSVAWQDWKACAEALALPTADELKLSDPAVQKRLAAQWGFVLPTATPAGERDAFEHDLSKSPFEFDMDRWPDNAPVDWPGSYKQYHVQCAWDAWQARAALSAGDAVDGLRLDFIEKSARCDPKMDGQHVWWPTSLNKALKGPTLRDAIDAAMRKGQL